MKIIQWQFLHPRFWSSWLGLILMRLSIYLPVRMQLWMGALLAWLMVPLMKDRKKIAIRNLELCFPELSEEQRQEMLKQNFQKMGMMMIETALSWWASDDSLLKRVRYEGLEHLEQAIASKKGVIILSGHFTCMEIGGRLLSLKIPGHVFFRPMKNALFNVFMMAARKRFTEGIIKQQEPRAMFKVLKQGKAVWFAPDQDFGAKQSSIYATFFGVKAATTTFTAKMVKMTGAAVILFVPKREDDGSYTLRCQPAVTNFPSGDELADAQRINDIVEQEIRRMPEQYFWVHRRFKTQPEGKGLLYKHK
ncbi:MAG: LpxL/LpxP family Kdo(2)-lipid IV(A) lauroyl/palmitoleoyl acyltransferase [Methylophagaceae bacterium]